MINQFLFGNLLRILLISCLGIFLFPEVKSQSKHELLTNMSVDERVKWFKVNYDSINKENYREYGNSLIALPEDVVLEDSLVNSWYHLFKAKLFSYTEQTDSLLLNAEYALTDNDENDEKEVGLRSNYLIASTFFKLGKYEDALPYYMEALNLSEGDEHVKLRGMALCKIGEIRAIFLDIENSMVYFQSAEEVLRDYPDKKMLVMLFNKKGNALFRIMRYGEAQHEFKKSIELSRENKYYKELIVSNLALGKVFTIQDSVNYAIHHFNEAIDISHEINDEQLIGRSYLDFGEFWFEINSYRKAEHYLNKSIQFLNKQDDIGLIAKSYLLLGKSNYLQKKYRKAGDYLTKSIEIQTDVLPNGNLLEAYEMLSKVFYLSNKFEKAYHYLKISKILGDSLIRIDNEKQIRELQVKYETENNRKTISTLKEVTKVYEGEKSKNKVYLYILLIGFILTSIVTIFLYAQYSINRKNLAKLEQQNDEIKKKNVDLKSATTQAKESKFVQEQFINSISHELKTPLTTILGSLDILERTAVDSEHKLLFENLSSSSENLLIVINELLDFSEINKGSIELDLAQSDIHKLLNELAEKYTGVSNKKGVTFEYEIDKNLPQWAYIDQAKLKKVLNNILENAIKFTHVGSVRFKTTVLEKNKTFNGARVRAEFLIEDTGIGISNELKENIFKSFSRGTNSVSQGYRGIGLGLTIAKEYVQSMGGEISFESTTGKGSSFNVIIEFKSDKKAIVSNVESERKNSMARFNNEIGVLYPLRILVAEDNSTNLAFIMTVLRKLGYTPDAVVNGQEVLDIMKENKYDIILMDIQMPVMDGITATKEIHKRMPKGQQPIIIAVTANAAGSNKLTYLEAGLDDFISKPFTSKDLEKLIIAWYKRINNQA